jgi:Domain of unknown function (DUF6930)
MAKKKKIVKFPQTVESQIRSRARNLELGKCYINTDWEESRAASIFITRNHSNGNLTVGIFYVDLALLGIKDVFYYFNIPQSELDDLMREGPGGEDIWTEIDYEIAHNIIYGAYEYALDFEFKAHKNFSVGKYILEEDDDHIALIDIEMGFHGKPTVFCTNQDSMQSLILHMEKTVGPGNFIIFNVDDPEQNDELFSDQIDPSDSLMQGWDDDIDEMGVLDWGLEEMEGYFKRDPEKISFRVLQFFVDIAFEDRYIPLERDSEEIVLGKAKISDDTKEKFSKEEKKVLVEVEDLIKRGKPEYVIKVLEEGAKDNPQSLGLRIIYLAQNAENLNMEESKNEYQSLYNDFPDNLEVKCLYCRWLIDSERIHEIPGVFDHKFTLPEICPKKKSFTTNEVMSFCSLMCTYFMETGDLIRAEDYYDVMDNMPIPDFTAMIAMQDMVLAKREYMVEEEQKLKLEVFEGPSDKVWEDIYDLSSELYQLQPWDYMDEMDVFGVKMPNSGKTYFINIIGQLGEVFALSAYEGANALMQFWDINQNGDKLNKDYVLRVPHLMLSFDDKKDVLPDQAKAMAKLGRDFGKNEAWPNIRHVIPGLVPKTPESDIISDLFIILQQSLNVLKRSKTEPHFINRIEDPEEVYLIRESVENKALLKWKDSYQEVVPHKDFYRITYNTEQISRLNEIPKSRDRYLFDAIMLPTPVREKGSPDCFPFALLLANKKTGIVDGFKNVLPLPDINSMYASIPAKLLDLLLNAKKHPAEIIVRTDMMLQLLNKVFAKTDIKITQSYKMQVLDEAAEALIKHLK